MFATQLLFSRKWLLAALMGFTFLLSGCSPEYNWREFTVADGRALVAFPDRVQTETRSINLDAQPLEFSLTTAAVKQNLFAVGYAPLPGALTPAQQTAVKQALLKSLAANLGVALPETANQGEPFVLESHAAKPMRMVARVVIHRGYLLQFIVTGPPSELLTTISDEFMRSVSLR
jgi:hypothetical protein